MSNGYRIPFEEMLKCSVCQGRIKDAKSLPCGHTYCKDCLTRTANATNPRGSIQCVECKNTSQLPFGGAEGLPSCFAINSLLDDIHETFGGGGSVTLGRHGFQVRDTFTCAFCLNLMIDARYLPCGHSFCRECLTMQPRTTPVNKCSKCQKGHNLPAQGIDGLPVAYRINSIVAEIRSNDNETNNESQASSSQNRRHQPPHPHRSPDTICRPLMEDVGEAKRRAQTQVLVQQTNGKTHVIDTSSNTTIGDLQGEIKTKTSIDQSQQRLTFSGRNLPVDDKTRTRTLSSYGIGNLSTINMTERLCGGSR